MLRRLLSVAAVGLLAGPAALAQVYEPGYVVKASGDTLRGEVENCFWDEPPTHVRFRPAPDAPSQLLLPRQVRAFNLTGGRYFQFQVLPIDFAAQTTLNGLPASNFQDVRPDSVLAEVLVEGPVMVWRVQRDGTLHLLLRRPGQPVLELTERRYLRRDEAGRQIVTDGNNYRNQLLQYFGDCPAVVQALDGMGYSAREVVALVRTYYQSCAPGQGVAHSWLARSVPRRRSAFQGGVLGGLRYNRIGENDCADCAVRPFGGLYVEVLQPSRTTAIYGELSLSTFANKTTRYSPSTGQVYNTYSYTGLLTTARIGVRYLSPLPHEQYVLLGLGLEMDFVTHATVTQTSGLPSSYRPDTLQFAVPTLLPNLTVGWRHQRLTLLADVQLYHARQGGLTDNFSDTFFGSGVAVRVGASYRLGPHPDKPRAVRAAAAP